MLFFPKYFKVKQIKKITVSFKWSKGENLLPYCQNCGSEIGVADTFCSSCGEQVKASKKVNSEFQSSTSNSYNSQPDYTVRSTPGVKKLYRSRDERVIAGVCGGLSKHFNIDPNIVRLGFILISIIYGSGILIYILMAILVPEEP